MIRLYLNIKVPKVNDLQKRNEKEGLLVNSNVKKTIVSVKLKHNHLGTCNFYILLYFLRRQNMDSNLDTFCETLNFSCVWQRKFCSILLQK